MRDVVIIGGGHNGLVAAALLARAGLRPLVVERAERIGGCAITSEIAPGFLCPTLAHRAAIDRGLIRALDLERHGLEVLRPAARVCAPTADGRELILWADTARAAREISAFSPGDAEFAIVLSDDWQGRGLGTRLLASLLVAAKNHGVRRLVATTLSENDRMLALGRKLGFKVATDPGSAMIAPHDAVLLAR